LVELYFKHLFPSMPEWREEPFTPWAFQEQVLLSVLPFFESPVLTEDLSLREELQCKIFMDSGAFAAAAMNFIMDPFEVAEMQAILKADLMTPLDHVIFEYDTAEEIEGKITTTLRNTEILLDHKPKGSEIVAPLQGFAEETLTKMFDCYRSLGLQKFALGGVVFQNDYELILKRITVARAITKGQKLHVFGRFLHPQLLKDIILLGVDSIDGYGYITSSIKGLYIQGENYTSIQAISEEELKACQCQYCQEYSLQDFMRGDKESQLLLIQHNIIALTSLAAHFSTLKNR